MDRTRVPPIDGQVNLDATAFNYNRSMGVLECIKSEWYRRQVGPYEDKKIRENGDV